MKRLWWVLTGLVIMAVLIAALIWKDIHRPTSTPTGAGISNLLRTLRGKQMASKQLNLGVEAYKNARYEEAITHFQLAASYDPAQIDAHMYLATAYMTQYIPGVHSEDNDRLAHQALDQYSAVLQHDPKNINSVKGIAYLYEQTNRYDDAKNYYRKATELDPNDPDSYYSIAAIDWFQTRQSHFDQLSKLGLKPEEPLKDKKICAALRETNDGLIEDGINHVNKALQLRPKDDRSMAWGSLLYRERANLECDDPVAREADLKVANEWDRLMRDQRAQGQAPDGLEDK